uniref:Uncharacterized protein n=1 Tax=Pithovirus LCPAC401 TaxID=2506595 RepID=A0A481ZBW5_9VIRU|nr:MAG: hypothetical protein LCPAC401_02070 [Pithovirus LCPAC401]
MTSTITKPCGSTKTKSGKSCRAKVKGGGLCYNHNKDAIRCGALTSSRAKCTIVVSKIEDKCPRHSIKCGALTNTKTKCVNVVSKIGYKCTDHGGEEKITMERVCTKCDKMKPFEEFYKDKRVISGITARCRECINAEQLSRNYKRLIEGTKKCSKCRELKDVSKYSSYSRTVDGLYSACKECHKRRTEDTKKCSKCGELKDVSQYVSALTASDGLHSQCRKCQKRSRDNINHPRQEYGTKQCS